MREPQNSEAIKELSAAVAKFIAASVDDPEAEYIGFTGSFMYMTPDGTVIATYVGYDGKVERPFDSLTLALIYAESAMNVISDVRVEENMRASRLAQTDQNSKTDQG